MSLAVIQPIQMYEPYNGIKLANSEIARPFNIRSDWHHIRLGVRMVWTTGSATTVSDIHLTMGVCSGSNLYYSNDCGHFAGWQWYGNPSYYENAGSAYRRYASNTVRTIKKIGATQTQFSSDVDAQNTFFICEYAVEASQNKAAMIFMDLTRPTDANGNSVASGSYTGSFYKDWNISGLNDSVHTELDFLACLPVGSPVSITSPTYWGNSGVTPHYFNIDETTDGYFNSVYIGWDKENPNPEIKISHIGVAIID